MNKDTNILEVKNLKVYFPIAGAGNIFRKKEYVKAVDDISFSVPQGTTFGLVGESGCGKSTTARTIVRLNNPTDGNVFFENKDIAHAQSKELLALRQDIQMIFQDPYASLNPRMTVQSIISEPLQILKNNKIIDMSTSEIDERVSVLLQQVGLRDSMKKRFPHEFSGGQRQRIGIARAIASFPKLVVADEPISALDVSIQAQILNLLNSLQKDLGLTYVFIAHDLAVVRYICDTIAVMYLGSIMELAESKTLNSKPLHPYTQMLLEAVLVPDPQKAKHASHKRVQGEIELLTSDHKGCPFYNRCPLRKAECKEQKPPLKEVQPNHYVACFLY